MRIYISGPMTGKPKLNRWSFLAAEMKLRNAGHFIISPFDISGDFGTATELAESFRAYYEYLNYYGIRGEDLFTRREASAKAEETTRLARAVMDADLAAVRSCDAIYLLHGWEESRGAKKELAEAIAHGLKVILEKDKKGIAHDASKS